MSSGTEQAPRKEQHELLFGLLKEHYAGLIDFEFKQGVVLTLVFGWVLTSDSARSFLTGQTYFFRLLMCALLLLLSSFHAIWVLNFYKRSQSVFQHLVEINYMPSEYFESRRIPRFTLISFWIIHGVVTLSIALIVVAT